jgi:hypothetical protein
MTQVTVTKSWRGIIRALSNFLRVVMFFMSEWCGFKGYFGPVGPRDVENSCMKPLAGLRPAGLKNVFRYLPVYHLIQCGVCIVGSVVGSPSLALGA